MLHASLNGWWSDVCLDGLGACRYLCYICRMIRCIAVLVFCSCWCPLLFGQVCPANTPDGPPKGSEARALRGKLIYHDSLRQWFELKLDEPECGQSSIELTRGDQSPA